MCSCVEGGLICVSVEGFVFQCVVKVCHVSMCAECVVKVSWLRRILAPFGPHTTHTTHAMHITHTTHAMHSTHSTRTCPRSPMSWSPPRRGIQSCTAPCTNYPTATCMSRARAACRAATSRCTYHRCSCVVAGGGSGAGGGVRETGEGDE